MNHGCGCSVVVRDVKVGIVALHVVCPVRVTVKKYNILILFKKFSEASFVLVALEIGNRVEKTPVVIDVAFAEERVALGCVEEGVEIEINSLVLVFLKHRLKPILLLVGYKLNERNICVPDLAEEDENIAVCLVTGINEIISVVGYIEDSLGLVVGKYADINISLP